MLTAPTVPPTVGANSFIATLYSHRKPKTTSSCFEKIFLNMTQNTPSKSVLTLAEAAEYMGLKKSYLYRLTHEKRIRHYKPNNKMIYFMVEDIIAWLTSNPIFTDEELSEQAQSYCLTVNKRGKNHGC